MAGIYDGRKIIDLATISPVLTEILSTNIMKVGINNPISGLNFNMVTNKHAKFSGIPI